MLKWHVCSIIAQKLIIAVIIDNKGIALGTCWLEIENEAVKYLRRSLILGDFDCIGKAGGQQPDRSGIGEVCVLLMIRDERIAPLLNRGCDATVVPLGPIIGV